MVIWGAGNIGELVMYILSYNSGIRVSAFLDDDPRLQGNTKDGTPILKPSQQALQDLRGDGVSHGIVAIGNGRLRQRFSQQLEDEGYQITNAVHPTAHISPHVNLGKGAIICSRANLFYNPVIGDYVYIAPSVTVTHDTVVEDNVELCAGCVIGARVRICKNAYLGIGVTVVPKDFGSLTVGEGSMVGAGTLVLQDVPPASVVVGSPARVIRYQNEQS